MKILLLADEPVPALWEHLDRRRLEGVDLIVSCGDLPPTYLSFLTCFTPAPIYYVHGNHDGRYLREPPEGCECIDGRLVRFQGLRILGLGGSIRYNAGPHQYTEREMEKRIRGLSGALRRAQGFDLLISHAPALGLGDDADRAHTGFACFRALLDRYAPRYMAHGHVHQSYRFDFQRTRDYNGTTIVNAFGSHVLEFDWIASEEKKRFFWKKQR